VTGQLSTQHRPGVGRMGLGGRIVSRNWNSQVGPVRLDHGVGVSPRRVLVIVGGGRDDGVKSKERDGVQL
jgi:hypothetical protein